MSVTLCIVWCVGIIAIGIAVSEIVDAVRIAYQRKVELEAEVTKLTLRQPKD